MVKNSVELTKFFPFQLEVKFPHPDGPAFSSNETADEKIGNLERLIFADFRFTKLFWRGGDDSLPLLRISRKRKHGVRGASTSELDSDDEELESNGGRHQHFNNTADDVDTIVERKLKSFKEALLADMRVMLEKVPASNQGQSSKPNILNDPNAPKFSNPKFIKRSALPSSITPPILIPDSTSTKISLEHASNDHSLCHESASSSQQLDGSEVFIQCSCYTVFFSLIINPHSFQLTSPRSATSRDPLSLRPRRGLSKAAYCLDKQVVSGPATNLRRRKVPNKSDQATTRQTLTKPDTGALLTTIEQNSVSKVSALSCKLKTEMERFAFVLLGYLNLFIP